MILSYEAAIGGYARRLGVLGCAFSEIPGPASPLHRARWPFGLVYIAEIGARGTPALAALLAALVPAGRLSGLASLAPCNAAWLAGWGFLTQY